MDVYSELIESLEKCVEACNNCALSCLDEANVQSLVDCVKLDLDCGDICQMSLKLLARNSNYAMPVVELCEYVCAECAVECERHDYDHCQQCTAACRRSEQNCRNYVNQNVSL